MSKAAWKIRWRWVIVAVIGFWGAAILPLGFLTMKEAGRPVAVAPSTAPEQRLMLKPATTPGTSKREPASLTDPDPTGPHPGEEPKATKATGYGHGTAIGKGKNGHNAIAKTDDKPDDAAKFAAGPLGPPDPSIPAAGTAVEGTSKSPTTTSPEQIKQQLPGRFSLSAPTKMQVGRSEHVTVVAAVEQLRALVTTELQAVTGEQNPQTVSTKDLPLSRLLRIELRADSDADFEIRAFTQADQRLSDQQVTTWEWSVTPKSDGDKHLTVVISNLVDGQGQPIAVTIAHRSVRVTQSILQQIREVSGIASSAASALAGLVGTWLGLLKPILQRRREEDGKPGSKAESDSKPTGKPASDPPEAKPTGTSEAKPDEPYVPMKPERAAAPDQPDPDSTASDPHSPK